MTQICQNMNATEIFIFHFLTIWQPFLHILGDFRCFDHSAKHQKLNIIEK